MVAGARRGEFVGREEEFARLDAALEARAERPCVFVGGEAGIGKTRLVREFTADAAARGALTISGGCLESGADVLPFAPFVEALGRLHEALPADSGLFDGPDRAELGALVPALGRQAEQEPERIRLYEAVRALFDRAPDPTILVLEDLHWTDRSSLELVSYLVRRLRHARTLVIATFRSDELQGEHPAAAVIAELTRSRAQRIELAPLAAATIARIVEGAWPTARRDGVAAIAAQSEGNPFFAAALAEARWRGADGIPANLRDLLLLGVDALERDARAVLELVSVAGRPMAPAFLRAAWAGRRAELDRGVAQAVERGLLVTGRDGCVGFRHALVGEAVQARLAPLKRARLHERLATLLAQRSELGAASDATKAAELAGHWVGAGRDIEAFASSIRAAVAAEHVPAWAEARNHYQRALSIWQSRPDLGDPLELGRAQVIERAALAALLAGDATGAVTLQRRAIAATDETLEPARAGARYAVLARFLRQANQIREMVPEAERAVALVPSEPPSADRALALTGLALSRGLAWRLAEARTLAAEATSMAASCGVLATEACARSILGNALWELGDEAAGEAELDAAVERAEASGDWWALYATYHNRLNTANGNGNRAAARRAIDGFRAAAERHDTSALIANELRFDECALQFADGAWDACEAGLTEMLSAGLDPYNADSMLLLRGRMRVNRGQLGDGEADLRAASTVYGGRSTNITCGVHLSLAEAAFIADDAERALGIVDDAIRLLDHADRPLVLVELFAAGLRAGADAAATARLRRDRERVRHAGRMASLYLARLDATLFERSGAGRIPSRASTALSLWGHAEASRLVRSDEPVQWAAAAAAFERWYGPHLVAYARYREAAALLARGRRDDASTAFRLARDNARRLGLEPLLENLASLGRRGRLSVEELEMEEAPAAEGLDRFGLSPRELEVIELLVEGRTNRQIGEALFITEKTASVHVTHILDKLGVPTRGAAAAAAARLQRRGEQGPGRGPSAGHRVLARGLA